MHGRRKHDRQPVAYFKAVWIGGAHGHEAPRLADVPAALQCHTQLCSSRGEARRVATQRGGRAVVCTTGGALLDA